MSGYDRCEPHGLLRSVLCSPSVPQHAGSVVAFTPPTGVDIEDLLDRSMGAVSTAVVSSPSEDRQLLEAIERQKALKSGAAVEVNFGDPVGEEIAAPIIAADEPAVSTIPTPVSSGVGEAAAESSPIGGVDADPIVAAAKEYSLAHRQAEINVRKIGLLTIELQEAELRHKASVEDLANKKEALKKLVAA
jgi:hypothetical protein